MYSKEELLIFSFINSNYDISIQNLSYKIFNFSNLNPLMRRHQGVRRKLFAYIIKHERYEDTVYKAIFIFTRHRFYAVETRCHVHVEEIDQVYRYRIR